MINYIKGVVSRGVEVILNFFNRNNKITTEVEKEDWYHDVR